MRAVLASVLSRDSCPIPVIMKLCRMTQTMPQRWIQQMMFITAYNIGDSHAHVDKCM